MLSTTQVISPAFVQDIGLALFQWEPESLTSRVVKVNEL